MKITMDPIDVSFTDVSNMQAAKMPSQAMSTRILSPVEIIKTLTSKTPVNNFSLPTHIYRADLLPSDITEETLTDLTLDDSEVRVAQLPIAYEEGYPSISGFPIWVQFPFEPDMAFYCFQEYLSQGAQGARQLWQLLDCDIIKKLPERITLEQLQEWYHLYYWTARVKGYDLFQTAHRQRQRIMRAIETDNDHLIFAERMMNICSMYLDANQEELVENMTPKAFLEMFKTATTLQRAVLSLPSGAGGKHPEATQAPQTIEMSMRTIAQKSGMSSENNTNNSEQIRSGRLHELMQDPEMIKIAQELIIRIDAPRQPTHQAEQLLPVN